MNELFGIPLDTFLAILGVALGVAFGILAVLVLRNPVLVRLGVRNVGRRRGRTGLIVLGLMLGTTIVAAALVTGDTMSHTIRTTAVAALGESDEIVSARGAVDDIPGELGMASGVGWLPAGVVGEIESAVGPDLTDGVLGAVVDNVALQAPRTRQTEPSVTLFAAEPARLEGFAPITGPDGDTLAHRAGARRGLPQRRRRRRARSACRATPSSSTPPASRSARPSGRSSTSRAPARPDAAVLLPLDEAQRLYGHPGEILGVMISNEGTGDAAVALSDQVLDELGPVLRAHSSRRGAQAGCDRSRRRGRERVHGVLHDVRVVLDRSRDPPDLPHLRDARGRAPRKISIARAIGTRRGHLVQMFTFEGAAYDLIAAAVGAILGAIVAYGMVALMARAFGAEDADAGLQVQYAFTWQSLLIAFALGVLTLLVVAFSAWRVSVMTIAAAIRNVPEPPVVRKRRRIVLGGIGIVLGLLLAVARAAPRP